MITVTKASPRKVYRSSVLPASTYRSFVEWTNLGWNDQYTVTMDRFDGSIKVYESIWNEDEQDWDTADVSPEDVDLEVVLP